MRIGISGAQGVGKTTLLNALKLQDLPFTFKGEITRTLKSQGFNINEQGTDSTQLEIMKYHLKYLETDNCIYDRTVLDGLVYTEFLYNTGKVNKNVLNNVLSDYHNNINNYDILFYIEPEFSIDDDGERSTDISFRDSIVRLFDYYINKDNLKVVMLSGDVESRVNTVINTISSINNINSIKKVSI